MPKEKLNYVVVPFDQIFDALRRGDAEVGLIIHEGQLTYAAEGFSLSADLGQWWFAETGGLPLPLGGNAVKKSLGPRAIAELSEILYAEHQVWPGTSRRRRGARAAARAADSIRRWPTSSSGCM